MTLYPNRETASQAVFDLIDRIAHITVPANNHTFLKTVSTLCSVTGYARIEEGKDPALNPYNEEIYLLPPVTIGKEFRDLMGKAVYLDDDLLRGPGRVRVGDLGRTCKEKHGKS